ncbi:MAG TPA: hypothetical protein VF092_10380 [Longimicrobium sp.]
MRKIRLDLEELVVEAFATTGGKQALRGTVRGHESEVCWTNFCDSPGGSNGAGCFDPNSLSGMGGCICPRQVASAEQPC